MQNNYLKQANSIGLFLASLFTICFIWYYIMSVERELHLSLFRMTFLWFKTMNISSFILGIIQSYLWAYVGLAIWRIVKR